MIKVVHSITPLSLEYRKESSSLEEEDTILYNEEVYK